MSTINCINYDFSAGAAPLDTIYVTPITSKRLFRGPLTGRRYRVENHPEGGYVAAIYDPARGMYDIAIDVFGNTIRGSTIKAVQRQVHAVDDMLVTQKDYYGF